jgi:hypothetical protein
MNEMRSVPFDRDPLDPAGLTDLPSFYKELRDHHPAYYYEDYDTFFISRFQVSGTCCASETTHLSRAKPTCRRAIT